MKTIVNIPSALQNDLTRLTQSLPPLPPLLRYYDDFQNDTHSIKNLSETNVITVLVDGRKKEFDLDAFGPLTALMKHIMVDWFHRLDPTTVVIKISSILRYLSRYGLESVIYLFVSSPFDSRSHWNSRILPTATADQSWALRAVLHSLCRLNFGEWSPAAASIIRALKSPRVDKYRVVRAGDCFLPLSQQALIVNEIDAVCSKLAADPTSVDGVVSIGAEY